LKASTFSCDIARAVSRDDRAQSTTQPRFAAAIHNAGLTRRRTGIRSLFRLRFVPSLFGTGSRVKQWG
jgi:hypothetical protein